MTRCPAHDDGTASLKIDDGENGTTLVHCHAGCSQEAVIAELRDRGLWSAIGDRSVARSRRTVKPAPVAPVPANASAPSFKHPQHGEPSSTWAYRDASGALLFYVCRFDRPGGRKEIAPLSYTAAGWRWLSATRPRPLYGLELLAAKPGAQVIVVEGEKAADSLRALLGPDYPAVVVTWPGGAKATDYVDWSPLAGRKIVICPDNDEPGMAAALNIAAILSGERP
jgi:hypothetical protein